MGGAVIAGWIGLGAFGVLGMYCIYWMLEAVRLMDDAHYFPNDEDENEVF